MQKLMTTAIAVLAATAAHAASNTLPRDMVGMWCAVEGQEDTYYRTERGDDCPANDVKPWYIMSPKHLAVSTFDCRVTKVNKRHVALLVDVDCVQSFQHNKHQFVAYFEGELLHLIQH
jgi:hypothetical protein